MATVDGVKSLLTSGGEEIAEEKRLGNNSGTQLKLKSGVSVNVFDKGTVQVQGPKPHKERVDGIVSGVSSSGQSCLRPRKAFVVYGHDEDALTQVEAMLRRWDVDPIILNRLPSGGQTIIEKLETHTSEASFAVVLATPDDEGHRAGHEGERMFRARQNVVLELGMMFAKLGRQRVAILLKEQANTEKPSDIQGLIYIPFKDRVDEVAVQLAKEMSAQGIPIDLQKV